MSPFPFELHASISLIVAVALIVVALVRGLSALIRDSGPSSFMWHE